MTLRSRTLVLASAAMLNACTPSGSGTKGTEGNASDPTPFDRGTLLQDLSHNVIMPTYAQAHTAAMAQQQAMENFAKGANLANLTAARAAWNTMMDAWMACEVFNFGPQYTENLGQRIAYRPINTTLIESEINGSGPVDEGHMAATGVTRKGLHAMEYLLYGTGNADKKLLDDFIMGAHADRRRAYLRSLSMDIAARIATVYQAWSPTGGNYAGTFTKATQSDINGSLGQVVNAWIAHIENVRREKVQTPAGTGMGGTAQPDLVENKPSGRSLANITIAIAQWERLLDSGGGVGIDDNLSALNARSQHGPLAEELLDQLNAAQANCSAITLPLDQALTGRPAQVNDLNLTLKRLTVLTKVDLVSSLGVIVTFSDNDGD